MTGGERDEVLLSVSRIGCGCLTCIRPTAHILKRHFPAEDWSGHLKAMTPDQIKRFEHHATLLEAFK